MTIKVYPTEIERLQAELDQLALSGQQDLFFRFRDHPPIVCLERKFCARFVKLSQTTIAAGAKHVTLEVPDSNQEQIPSRIKPDPTEREKLY